LSVCPDSVISVGLISQAMERPMQNNSTPLFGMIQAMTSVSPQQAALAHDLETGNHVQRNRVSVLRRLLGRR
jgi:hypothetical protein